MWQKALTDPIIVTLYGHHNSYNGIRKTTIEDGQDFHPLMQEALRIGRSNQADRDHDRFQPAGQDGLS